MVICRIGNSSIHEFSNGSLPVIVMIRRLVWQAKHITIVMYIFLQKAKAFCELSAGSGVLAFSEMISWPQTLFIEISCYHMLLVRGIVKVLSKLFQDKTANHRKNIKNLAFFNLSLCFSLAICTFSLASFLSLLWYVGWYKKTKHITILLITSVSLLLIRPMSLMCCCDVVWCFACWRLSTSQHRAWLAGTHVKQLIQFSHCVCDKFGIKISKVCNINNCYWKQHHKHGKLTLGDLGTPQKKGLLKWLP